MILINDLKKIEKKRWIIFSVISIALYIGLLFFYHGKQLGFHYMLDSYRTHSKSIGGIIAEFMRTLPDGFTGFYGVQRKLVFMLLQVVLFVFIAGPKRFLSGLFKHRYIVALLFMIFVTANRLHGDPMGAYHYYVQPGVGDLRCNPIFGEVRAIRSDEWGVQTPAKISASYGEHPYSKKNDILRGGNTVNSINAVYVSYSALGKNILYLVYPVLGVERGFSFMWWGQIVLTFLISLEFFYIVSKRKRLPAVTGALLITCSSFYMWWAFPMILWTSQGALVGFYYFINTDKLWKRIAYGAMFAICFASFCTILYPAWQVPFGYVSVALAVWMIHDNWSRIKQLKIRDYLIFAGMLVWALTLVAAFIYDNADYIKTISKTVYPGNRISTGGFNLSKLFYYVQAVFYPYKDIGLTSEYACFISLFPLPIIVGFVRWFKKKDWYAAGLCISAVPLLLYCTTGLPKLVCSLTLLSKTTTIRAVDTLGYVCVLLLVELIALEDRSKVWMWLGIASVVLAVIVSFVKCHTYWNILMVLIILAIFIPMLITNRMAYLLIAVSLITGITVRPVMQGFYPVWSKPVANEIRHIVSDNPEGLWIGAGPSMTYQGFLSICGARCENTTNFYPDMEFWHILDPEGRYEDVYNRYAHVTVEFTEGETTFELVAQDSVHVNISYNKLEELGINYIFTDKELSTNAVALELLYSEYGSYIYEVK